MSLTGARNQLQILEKNLSAEWLLTKEQWRDAKSREFQKRYLDSLHANVNSSMEAIERLSAVLKKIRRDCE